jgi:hypothetical protein
MMRSQHLGTFAYSATVLIPCLSDHLECFEFSVLQGDLFCHLEARYREPNGTKPPMLDPGAIMKLIKILHEQKLAI